MNVVPTIQPKFWYKTQRFHPSGVQFSPFNASRLAVSASSNYGLVGNGQLYILDIEKDKIELKGTYLTQDSQLSLSWSELNEHHIIVGSGDGQIRLFDLNFQSYPIQVFKEHGREVYCTSWNMTHKNLFASSSWDGQVKVWDITRPTSQVTISACPSFNCDTKPSKTKSCVYSTSFSIHSPFILGSVADDGFFKMWDTRNPRPSDPVMKIQSNHGQPVLSFDWNKYRPMNVVSAGIDGQISVLDLRNMSLPVIEAIGSGHKNAIRTVKTNNHNETIFASGGYDMEALVWSFKPNSNMPPKIVANFKHHTEFVTGLDWSLWGSGSWIASVGWDSMVYIWTV